jgi:hypothetical protein
MEMLKSYTSTALNFLYNNLNNPIMNNNNGKNKTVIVEIAVPPLPTTSEKCASLNDVFWECVISTGAF